MNERQKHGFFFEDYIIKKYNFQKEHSYGHQYDAYYGDCPVQIKFIKDQNAIELGDYLRNKNKNDDFILVIGFWKEVTHVYKEYFIKVNAILFKKMLPIIQDERGMIIEFESISCSRLDDFKWKDFIKKYRNTKSVIQLRFKRDHKSQKRIQCAIPFKKFEEFCSHFEVGYKILNDIITREVRDDKEQFYTEKTVAMDIIHKCIQLNLFDVDLIIEPSAGTGVFVDSLLEMGLQKRLLAFDIDPKHSLVAKQDFLSTDKNTITDALVIGNPPFGKQSCLAKKFIKHCEKAKYIAFILPRSFLKESMYNCFPKNFHKIYEFILPKNSFIFLDKSYNVPCVFLVYKKMDHNRPPIKKVKPNENYEYKLTDGSVAFKRVGGCAGQFRYEDVDKLSHQSHIFIKFNKDVDRTLLDNIKWEANNTVGPKSISKKELTLALNSICG